MNKWPLTAVALACALSAGTLVVAQTADDRKAVRQSINTTKLQQLRTDFQVEFERSEALVLDYLKRNPGLSRSLKVESSNHYLARIDVDGNPVYINSKDVSGHSSGALKNLASGQLIKADSLTRAARSG